MDYKLLSQIGNVEIIASGHGIRNLSRLNKIYGNANWRKLKGVARIQLEDGTVIDAELHWYEEHGIGRQELKIKRYMA